MSYKPIHMLVTGGAGFIGSNFVRHMLSVDSRVNIVNLDLLTYAGSLENVCFNVSFIVNLDVGVSDDLTVGRFSDLDENSVDCHFLRFACLVIENGDFVNEFITFDFFDFGVPENLHVLFGSHVSY